MEKRIIPLTSHYDEDDDDSSFPRQEKWETGISTIELDG